jgi:hypothetical protein
MPLRVIEAAETSASKSARTSRLSSQTLAGMPAETVAFVVAWRTWLPFRPRPEIDRAPSALRGPERLAAEAGLGEAEEEAVDRAQDALVVGRRRGIRRAAAAAHDRRRGDALQSRQAHVAVHVVTVGGVDVVAQPDAGVGDAELGLAEPGGDVAGRAGGRQGAVLEAEAGGAHGDLFEQRLGQAVVVVAGHEDDAPAGHRLAQLREERLDELEHAGKRQVAHLQRVAEQDEPIGGGDLVKQSPADLRVAGDVLAGGAAQVQVGDDRRAHPRKLAVQRFVVATAPQCVAPGRRVWLRSQSLARLSAWPS